MDLVPLDVEVEEVVRREGRTAHAEQEVEVLEDSLSGTPHFRARSRTGVPGGAPRRAPGTGRGGAGRASRPWRRPSGSRHPSPPASAGQHLSRLLPQRLRRQDLGPVSLGEHVAEQRLLVGGVPPPRPRRRRRPPSRWLAGRTTPVPPGWPARRAGSGSAPGPCMRKLPGLAGGELGEREALLHLEVGRARRGGVHLHGHDAPEVEAADVLAQQAEPGQEPGPASLIETVGIDVALGPASTLRPGVDEVNPLPSRHRD